MHKLTPFILIVTLLSSVACGTMKALSPTPAPTVTPQPPPDLTDVVLSVDDLPSGFIPIPDDGYDLSTDKYPAESSFAFVNV
jgi:hypothetical protein